MITLADQRRLTGRSAFVEFLQRRYDDDIDKFIDDLDAGLNHLLRSDLEKAARYVTAARSYHKYLPPRYEARTISLQARLSLWSGRYKEALSAYGRALTIFQRYRDWGAAARLRKGLVEVYMYLGRYPEALATGKSALRYFRARKLTIDVAQCLTNIGNVYHRMDRNRQALQYYDKARTTFARKGGIPLAIVEYNRANIYANLNELQMARSLYKAAADIYRRQGLELAENQANYAIAYLCFLESKYTEALVLFERVHEAFTRLADSKAAAITTLDLVELNLHLNQYGSAIMLGESAIVEFGRLGLRYEEAKGEYFLAVAKLELGDHQSAAVRLSRSDRLFRQEDNTLWLGMIEFVRSRMYHADRRMDRALAAAAAAESLFRRSGDVRRQHDAAIFRLRVLGELDSDRLRKPLANRLLQAGLVSSQKYNLLNVLADYHYDRSQFDRALKYYQSAVEVVETMMAGLFEDEIRYFFAVDKYHSYSRLVQCLLKLGRVQESFVRRLTALSLVNRSVVSDARLKSEVPAELLARIDRLRTRLHRMYGFPRTGDRVVSVSGAGSYQSLEQQLWQLQRKARTYLYRRSDTGAGVDWRGGQLPAAVPENTTLLSFLTAGSSVGAFVSNSRRTDYISLGISTDDLRSLIRKLSFVLEMTMSTASSGSRKMVAKSYLTQLYEALIEPVASRLGDERLMILAEADFNQVPFIALHDSRGDYLKDRYRISLVTNPAHLWNSHPKTPGFQALGNAVFAVPSETLPLVKVEGERIKQRFARSRLYVGEAASSRQLGRELSRVRGFVHVATHASRSSENPLFSRIIMGDGPFFPFDLFGIGVKAQLVTLSGCQTAAPGLYYGNAFSLANAFHQAGSRYVLASMWPVADEVTMVFMTEFYDCLARGDSVADSYYHAVSMIKARTDDPAFWGAFALLGC